MTDLDHLRAAVSAAEAGAKQARADLNKALSEARDAEFAAIRELFQAGRISREFLNHILVDVYDIRKITGDPEPAKAEAA